MPFFIFFGSVYEVATKMRNEKKKIQKKKMKHKIYDDVVFEV